MLRDACAGVAKQALHPVVVERARSIGPAGLRTLGAIHLSAAVSLGVAEILTFDHRLAQAATALGVKVIPLDQRVVPHCSV